MPISKTTTFLFMFSDLLSDTQSFWCMNDNDLMYAFKVT